MSFVTSGAVELETEGDLSIAGVDPLRLDSPPRLLVRVRGVAEPYAISDVPVDSPRVAAVRTGYHQGIDPPELHIVVDLASTAVELAGVDVDPDRVRVHLTGG